AHLLDVGRRERLVLVVLSRDRSDLALGELAHRAPKELLILGEQHVHQRLPCGRPPAPEDYKDPTPAPRQRLGPASGDEVRRTDHNETDNPMSPVTDSHTGRRASRLE